MAANNSNTSAAAAIGTVKASSGSVTVINASGATCALKPGDKVFAKDIIQTGATGAVQIQLVSGANIEIGRATSVLLDPKVFDPAQAKAIADAAAAALADAAAKSAAQVAAQAAADAALKVAADAVA